MKVSFHTRHDLFDSRSLSLAPLDSSKDRASTRYLTYGILEYLSTSYHQELLEQYAWSSVHPPLQLFLKVTTYQARI